MKRQCQKKTQTVMASVQAELAVHDLPTGLDVDELPFHSDDPKRFEPDLRAERAREIVQQADEPQCASIDEAMIDTACVFVQEIDENELGVTKGTLELIDLEPKQFVNSRILPLPIESLSKALILQEFERSWRALRLCSSYETTQEQCYPGKSVEEMLLNWHLALKTLLFIQRMY